MRLLAAMLIGLALAPTWARAEEYVLASRVAGPQSVTPGGELARIQKQRPLPNAFGSADIFGRKVDAGLIQFIYFGQAAGGQVMIRRIDIDVLSTATTMSRTPGFTFGQAWSSGHAWGTFSGGAQVFGMSPVGESNTVLPPRAMDFLVDPMHPIPLPTGHTVVIHRVEPQRVVFSVTEPKSTGSRKAPMKAPSGTKPDWVPW